MKRSIRGTLLLMLVGAMLSLWVITAIFSYIDARSEMDKLFDAQLAQSARLLLAQASHEIRELQEDSEDSTEDEWHGGEELEAKYGQKIYFQIWDRDGHLLFRSSRNTPKEPLTSQESGFANTQLGQQDWRVYSFRDTRRNLQIQVAQRRDIRNELATQVMLHILLPFLLALPFIAFLIWFSVGRGLRPLKRVAQEISGREADNLSALDIRDVPIEIRPLGVALNALFGRLSGAIENERRFTADAAHELRTPLAALKTQAQVALGAQERRKALDQIVLGVDRMSHLVQQLLTLARLDPKTAETLKASWKREGKKLSMKDLVTNVVRDLAPDAIEKNIEIEIEETKPLLPVEVFGDPAMLAILTRNIIDNAIRYTPRAGRVCVRFFAGPQASGFEVIDSGGGIPIEERARVFDRFYRVLGTGQSGSGLGLSIVKRIAELHGAEVRLDAGDGGIGLKVRVEFLS